MRGDADRFRSFRPFCLRRGTVLPTILLGFLVAIAIGILPSAAWAQGDEQDAAEGDEQDAAEGGSPPAEGMATPPDSLVPIEAEMILLSGGEFVMGHEGYADFSPPRTVTLPPFYIDKNEVTNAQYKEFCDSTGHRAPEFWGMQEYCSGTEWPNYPVVGVSWLDARAYARWRGVRLPTEAEWEYAARGGLEGKNFSHGDELDPTLYAPSGFTGSAAPSLVGSYPPNGFGLHDMTRNVCEWVRDWYDAGYYPRAPAQDPPGPGQGKFKVIRGGGWHTGPYCARLYIRTGLQSNWLDFNVGFRCAKYAGESAAKVIKATVEAAGIERALDEYQEMRAAAPGTYYFDEAELNSLGYHLINKEDVAAAIEIFRLLVEAFPDSYNAWDSFGEVYLLHGDKEQAIVHYRKSLELNPLNRGGREKLVELEEG